MQWFATSQLKSKDPRRRKEALGRLGDSRGHQTVTAVMSALGDAEVEVRLEALRVIVRWRDENTVRALTHVTRDPHPDVRERAISELGALGLRESIPAILPSLCDMAMPVRTAAVQSLN